MDADKKPKDHKQEDIDVIPKEVLEELSHIKPKIDEEEDDITLADVFDFSKNYIYLLIIIAASFIVYYPTLDNEFVWDDHAFIVNNEQVKSLGNIPSFFGQDAEGLYRPLRTTFYAIAYSVFGLNPFWYHLLAILIHIIASILIFYIILRVTDSRFISFASSLIFALHPAHTEAIAFITASFDQIATIFYLVAFLYYIKTSRKGKLADMNHYYLALFLFALAAFTSEIALTLPVIIVLYDWMFVEQNYRALKEKLRFYAPLFAILVGYLIIRFFLIGVIARETVTASQYFLGLATFTKVIAVYLSVLLYPKNLAIERTVPLATSVTELAVMLSLAIIAMLAFTAYYFRHKNKLVTFAIIFFFITLLPVSNIIPIQRFIAEAYLYLPLLGFALAGAVVIHYILKNLVEKRKGIAVLIVLVLVIPYSMITVARNEVWQDDMTLWSQAVQDSPFSSKTHANYALLLQQRSQLQEAEAHYLEAIRLNPYREAVYFNLATLYERTGRNQLAAKAYNVSIILNPAFADAHTNLGIVYGKLNQTELAKIHLLAAVDLNPNNALYRLNLGSFYNSINQTDLALQEFSTALQINPKMAEAHYNLGIVYLKQRQYDLAETEMEKALALNPKLLQAKAVLDDLRRNR